MTTDHRAEAEALMAETAAMPDAVEHLLAAIHDEQREQTGLLRALVEQAMPVSEPTEEEPKPRAAGLWNLMRREEFKAKIDSLNPDQDVLDALVDVAAAGVPPEQVRRLARDWAAGRLEADPEPASESVTVTLHPGWSIDGAEAWRREAKILRKQRPDALAAAVLCERFADALDVANAPSATPARRSEPLSAVSGSPAASEVSEAHSGDLAKAWEEGAKAAWDRSTPEVNGLHYWWRSHGEPHNPYRSEADE